MSAAPEHPICPNCEYVGKDGDVAVFLCAEGSLHTWRDGVRKVNLGDRAAWVNGGIPFSRHCYDIVPRLVPSAMAYKALLVLTRAGRYCKCKTDQQLSDRQPNV